MTNNACTKSHAAYASCPREPFRTVSWWLTWEDLKWPDVDVADKMRRRADICAGANVNMAVIFGAHFRWDYLPLWSRLHDLLAFIADTVHQRRIQLFDHHSSVLTHRPRTKEDARDIWRRNRHHIPFYPSSEAVAGWSFNGSSLNSWRMIDVETGRPDFLPSYMAEQFCVNNPDFRKAYRTYVRRLVSETGIDGLMSDDGIFYNGWRTCGCPWCRNRFRREYGRTLPPVTDLRFWGNRDSEAFKDWIEMRYRSVEDFLKGVRKTLPARIPLMTCCDNSYAQTLPSVGMTYEDFAKASNMVMLEMCGNTPALNGTWDQPIASQMLHLGIARRHHLPCIGAGYGFFPDTAFFVWAFNKFLGSDAWLSTLKGRLGLPDSATAHLADDPELVAEGYTFERHNPRLFNGESDAAVSVFFSRATRDYYGQCDDDYVRDYEATCHQLMQSHVQFDVGTDIPAYGKIRALVLSSVTCLSARQRRALARFLRAGGAVVATGPLGLRDERARPAARPWLDQFGIAVSVTEPVRPASFPPYLQAKGAAQCALAGDGGHPREGNWVVVPVGKGRLLWRPERAGDSSAQADLVATVRRYDSPANHVVLHPPRGWYIRRYRQGARILLHGLPKQVGVQLHPTLRNQMNDQGIIKHLRYRSAVDTMTIRAMRRPKSVTLYSPDLPKPRRIAMRALSHGDKIQISLSGIRRYFILEMVR